VNSHILHDTHANQFVTAFYGILNPAAGTLLYSNAGHCPGLLLSRCEFDEISWLSNTGVPLGILEEGRWEQREVSFAPCDELLLYTDGLIEAEDATEQPYSLQRLLASAKKKQGGMAVDLKEQILCDVQRFIGERPLLDDLVLLVASRQGC
jgi:sigma-B regulation protein RsbU (phosphoserine phosphatase)